MIRKILTGKNALVTGGNKGIGHEVVRRLSEEGCNVIFNSPFANQQADDYAKEISKKYGTECIHHPCDNRKPDEIENMVQVAKRSFNNVDILVNNAGKECFGSTEDLSYETLLESIHINFIGHFLFSQKCVPMMKEKKWGRIITFSSGTTHKVEANLGGYIHPKMGIHSLTKVLAKEVGDYGITVNCIVPGCIDTDMFNDGIKAFAQNLGAPVDQVKNHMLADKHIIKEIINPKKLSDFCIYLCSDSGAALTGALLPLDNGYTV